MIDLKGGGDRTILPRIAKAMNERFRATMPKTNMLTCGFYVHMGVFMALMGVGVVSLH